MNINLLPKKFIKNRAMEVIIVLAAILYAILIVAFLIAHLFFKTQVKTYTNAVQLSQLEKIGLENNVAELQKEQSKDMQEFIEVLKGEQKLMEPIMTAVGEAARELSLTLINYDIYLVDETEANNQLLVGDDGTELLPSIAVKFRGDLFTNSPSFKERIERIEWVYDCQPVAMNRDNDYTESDFVIRLKKAEVPMVAKAEEATDE
ncbi:hypothetical protein [Candidatus Enterococcus clewellii]|uniref:Uncharacterized protein n=1 Tax=Candidatus Enterococcus clewellii TaxID=1834193 RepID=A0A242KEM9_9ENTE|nr:hypothetical protein [Enterococcus sp. 9E7_DIV0242]OTP19238.1 hypothetical protein A5888_001053 [Enterococcus sp. 9E7_DIV0242]